jgi:hypothetical protein
MIWHSGHWIQVNKWDFFTEMSKQDQPIFKRLTEGTVTAKVFHRCEIEDSRKTGSEKACRYENEQN